MRTIARQVVGSSGDEERDPASRATEENRGAAVLVTCRCPVVGTPVHSSGTRLTLTLGGGPRARDRPRLCVKYILILYFRTISTIARTRIRRHCPPTGRTRGS